MKKTNKQLAQLFVRYADGSSEKHLRELSDVFVSWLRSRGETKRLPDIFRSIDQIWKEKYGSATMTIQTPESIDKKLRTALEHLANGAEIKEQIVPELIAGARVRIDDRIIDGSLLGALDQLTQTLRNAA